MCVCLPHTNNTHTKPTVAAPCAGAKANRSHVPGGLAREATSMPQRGCPAGPRPGAWGSEKAAISGDQLEIWTQEGRGEETQKSSKLMGEPTSCPPKGRALGPNVQRGGTAPGWAERNDKGGVPSSIPHPRTLPALGRTAGTPTHTLTPPRDSGSFLLVVSAPRRGHGTQQMPVKI